MRDTGIAPRLRAQGLRVIEVAGWQTRGSDTFDPSGSVNHHTAGSSTGSTPSLNVCIFGRSDLPGPLCNVYQARDGAGPGGTDTVYVVAAGRANHAGSGGWRGLSGNSSVYGLEIEHVGTKGVDRARLDTAVKVHAALIDRPGLRDPSLVCQHFEWAPDRKIDFYNLAPHYTPASFRSAVALYLNSSEDFDMDIETFKTLTRNIIRQELYGDKDAHSKGVTPIIQNEVKAVLPQAVPLFQAGVDGAFGTAGSDTREQLAGNDEVVSLVELALQRSASFQALVAKVDQLLAA